MPVNGLLPHSIENLMEDFREGPINPVSHHLGDFLIVSLSYATSNASQRIGISTQGYPFEDQGIPIHAIPFPDDRTVFIAVNLLYKVAAEM